MTIYIFYKIPPDGFVKTPTLYAWTNDKEHKERFMKERDMKKFILRKEKLKDKKDIAMFEDMYQKNYLHVFGLYTQSKITYGKMKTEVLGTVDEENNSVLKAETVFDEIGDKLIDTQMLKSKYINALNTLLYYKFYTYYQRKSGGLLSDFYTAYGPSSSFVDMELTEGHCYDELSVFVKMYGDTFK